MIRIIIREIDSSAVVHLGAKPVVTFKTFDVELPEIEAWLKVEGYKDREVIGVEVIERS